MLTYSDDLIYLVSAANIAGHMEKADTIVIPDDENLTHRLVDWINEYDALCALTDCSVNFLAFIEDRLEYCYGNNMEV